MLLPLPDASITYELRNYEIASADRPILFLHSALSSRREFDPLSSFYPSRKQILLDFPSHGESTTILESLTTQDLARYVHSVLEHLECYDVDIIGYSLGGYVGIELALMAPSMVTSIASHAMKFYWSEQAIASSLTGIDPTVIKARSEKGYAILSSIHAANGLERTSMLMSSILTNFRKRQLRSDDVRQLQCPLLLSVGDRDELVPPEEVSALYENLEKNRVSLAIHPNSPHPLSKLDLISFTHSLREFWKTK